MKNSRPNKRKSKVKTVRQLASRFALTTALSFVLADAISAQPGKKVYISVDMEGISGISGNDQLSPGGSEYGRSRKLMAEDANAAIREALAAGATEIVVNDSHGIFRSMAARWAKEA